LFFVIGFFFDLIFGVLANLTKRYMSDQRISFSITFLFNLIKNGLVLFLLDDLMRSITLSFTTKLILAFLLSMRSEEHTSELQSRFDLVCRLLLEKKKTDEVQEP